MSRWIRARVAALRGFPRVSGDEPLETAAEETAVDVFPA